MSPIEMIQAYGCLYRNDASAEVCEAVEGIFLPYPCLSTNIFSKTQHSGFKGLITHRGIQVQGPKTLWGNGSIQAMGAYRPPAFSLITTVFWQHSILESLEH